jgi:ammonia channel protein AmtB
MLIRLIFAVLAAYLVFSAAYVILILLLIAGLLFRTKETVGLIGLYWALRLFGTHPVATIAGILGLVVIGAMFSQKPQQQQSAGEPEKTIEPELLLLPSTCSQRRN